MLKYFLFFLILLSILILSLEWVFDTWFPNWVFSQPSLNIANRAITYVAFLGITLPISILLIKYKPLNKFAPVIIIVTTLNTIAVLFGILMTFYPIDTTTEPIDYKILKITGEKKLIERHYSNAVTTAEIIDSVWVEDHGIFRKLLNSKY